MDNNNNNKDTQEPERYPRDEEERLKYNWGADDTIMKIIKRKDNSPETRDLVRQRIALTKPGNMRHHYNKKLERQILVPRRPDEEERKEVKRIGLRLKRREEHRITHIGGGYFKNFGDQSSQEHQEQGTSAETPIERPSRRPPPPPKNQSQPKNPAHTRPSRCKNLETGQSRKSRYATYASTA